MKNLRMIVDGGAFDVAEAIRELAAAVLTLMPDENPQAVPAPAEPEPAEPEPAEPKRTRAVKK